MADGLVALTRESRPSRLVLIPHTSSPWAGTSIPVFAAADPGSYDANLRIFDARAPFKPIVTIPCAGGIWRTRFHPSPDRAGDILLACMQGGFTTVRLDERLVCPATSPDDLDWSALKFDAEGGEERSGRGDEGEEVYEGQGWKVLARMTDSSVLAYGADWSRLAPGEDGSLATTCSFYDHTMHVWRA